MKSLLYNKYFKPASTIAAVSALALIIGPDLALASVESTLSGIQSKILGTFLPLIAILGLLWAAFSFITGSPNAKRHLVLAVVGCVVGFGATSIVQLIQSTVH